jgi:hypothetical protein
VGGLFFSTEIAMAKTNFPPEAAALILARQQAHRIIVRKIRAEGRVPLSTLSHAVLSRLAIELVEACPQLVAEALPLAAELAPKERPKRPKSEVACTRCVPHATSPEVK